MSLEIRRPRHGEGPQLQRLHRLAFRRYGASTGGAVRQLRQCTLVAELEGSLVGFGCWHRGVTRRSLRPAKRPVPWSRPPWDASLALHTLLGSLEPTTRRLLDVPDHPVGLPLRVEAPPGLVVRARGADWVLTALAVHPEVRRRGVGTALARARIAAARRAGAHRVFVHCVAGSGSRPLYEAIGFTPLVTVDDYYRGGLAMTLLTLALGGP